jgi:hypothetical protein
MASVGPAAGQGASTASAPADNSRLGAPASPAAGHLESSNRGTAGRVRSSPTRRYHLPWGWSQAVKVTRAIGYANALTYRDSVVIR